MHLVIVSVYLYVVLAVTLMQLLTFVCVVWVLLVSPSLSVSYGVVCLFL